MWKTVKEWSFLNLTSGLDSILGDNPGDQQEWITTYASSERSHPNELQYYVSLRKDNHPTSGGPTNHILGSEGLELAVRWSPGMYNEVGWDSKGNAVFTSKHFNYTSAMMTCQQRFKFGYFEIDCRIPHGGLLLWPAFWLWEQDSNEYREIDVFEFGAKEGQLSAQHLRNLHLSRSADDNNLSSAQWDNVPVNRYGDDPPKDLPHHIDLNESFHKYAVKWTPNSVTWYFDGVEVFKVGGGHSPQKDMRLIVNIAVANWLKSVTKADLPAKLSIKTILVKQWQGKEFQTIWGNDYSLGGWHVDNGQCYICFGTYLTGNENILCLNPDNGWAKILSFEHNCLKTMWSNDGDGMIAGWKIAKDDQIIFVANHPPNLGATFLFKSSKGKLALFAWNSLSHTWSEVQTLVDEEHQYTDSDFDLSGPYSCFTLLGKSSNGSSLVFHATQDQLRRAHASVVTFQNTNHLRIWLNDGNGFIGSWVQSASDKYIAIETQLAGSPKVLFISKDGRCMIQSFNGLNWDQIWSNSGNSKISSWNMAADDEFVIGKFDNELTYRQILIINPSGWAKVLYFDFDKNEFSEIWDNQGAGTIHRLRIGKDVKYLPLQLGGHRGTCLLGIPSNGTVSIQRFTDLAQFSE